jgi:hypothetical protein
MFPAKKTRLNTIPTQTEIATMNRRPLVVLALVVASFVASACSSVTAPTANDTCSGFVQADGRCVEAGSK